MKISINAISLFALMFVAAAPGCAEDWHAYAESWLRGEPYHFGEPNSQPYFQEIASGFADPFFFPDMNYSQSFYYPYFEEDFFRFGYNPYEVSQRTIQAQRQQFETPYYELFGEDFSAIGELYPYYQRPKETPPIAQIISP